MDFTSLKAIIAQYIKENGAGEITGDILQNVLLNMVVSLGDQAINDLVTALQEETVARQNADGDLSEDLGDEATAREQADNILQGLINGISSNIQNGYVYAGIATPSSTPASGKVFYMALTAGTYTDYGNTEVPQGLNILKYNGSAWVLDTIIGIDNKPTQGSNNLVKSGGALESIIQDGPAFDLSAYNAQGGVLATYADLNAALTALNQLPSAYKKGGMSMKFVQTIDNKYVQYTSKSQSFTTNLWDWDVYNTTPQELYGKNYRVKTIQSSTFSNNILFYQQNIEQSDYVVFEIEDNDSAIKASTYFLNISVSYSDGTSGTLRFERKYPYIYKVNNYKYITRFDIIIQGSDIALPNKNITGRVHIGSYAKKIYDDNAAYEASIKLEDIQVLSVLVNKYINSLGNLTSLGGQPYSKVNIYDVTSYVGRKVRLRGSYHEDGASDYLWSIATDESFTDIISVSVKHSINSTSANIGNLYSCDELIIPSGAAYLALSAVEVPSSRESYLKNVIEPDEILDLTYNRVNDINATVRPQISAINAEIEEMEQDIEDLSRMGGTYDTDIIYWGDSILVGNQDGHGETIENVVQSIIGGTYMKCAIGGEETNDYAWRQGGSTMVIPAGNVNGTYARGELKDTFDAPFAALGNQTDVGSTINPVTLSNGRTCNIAASGNGWVISGYDGEAVNTPLLARSFGSKYKGRIFVMMPGANGTAISSDTNDRPYDTNLKAMEMYVDSMIAHHGNENFIILSFFGTSNEEGTQKYWDVIAKSAIKYGNRFVNSRQLLCEYGLQVNGLTPNEHVAKRYYRGSSVERTLENVISCTALSSTTIHVELTDNGVACISVNGSGIDIPNISAWSLDGTTLTYTSLYEVVIENEVAQIAGKHVPSRLIYDNVHPTHYGYYALGTFVAERMKALGYDKFISIQS